MLFLLIKLIKDNLNYDSNITILKYSFNLGLQKNKMDKLNLTSNLIIQTWFSHTALNKENKNTKMMQASIIFRNANLKQG